jgi:hypothetical protein
MKTYPPEWKEYGMSETGGKQQARFGILDGAGLVDAVSGVMPRAGGVARMKRSGIRGQRPRIPFLRKSMDHLNSG